MSTVGKILILALAAAVAPVAWGDPLKSGPAVPVNPVVRSVFTIPASPRDGRDPFFPESTRPYEEAVASTARPTFENSFAVKGFSYEHGHPMVIINNHTFALGDEGDVQTTSGRVHIRLAEIRATSVVIEVNGSRRELSTAIK
jgi:hypothetical protein